MNPEAQFEAVFPIGDTDPLHLPVANVEQAIAYYTDLFGFTLHSPPTGTPKTAVLSRDTVRLGFTENGGDSEQASCFVSVRDVTALRQEYFEKGIDVSEVGEEMEYGGKRYRVFWAKDPDGLCYCLGKQVD